MVVGRTCIHPTAAIRTVPNRLELAGVMTGARIIRDKILERPYLSIHDKGAFLDCLPTLAANVADFGDKSAPESVKALAAWTITEAAQQLGVKLNSPDALYKAVGEGQIEKAFAVPAINVRANSLDTARAIFAAAKAKHVGALIIEIARSEMSYTNQDPREFAAVIQAAAMLEGWRGQLFLQGDHIQLNAGKVRKSQEEAAKEEAAHSALIRQLLTYGFGSIDLDMSPFEKRDQEDLTFDEQQFENYLRTAQKVLEIRKLEKGLELPFTVMLGGETGEVGKINTRYEDIKAYAEGLSREIGRLAAEAKMDLEGIRKIAVQTGTSHGGVTKADGTKADVKIDFGVLTMARTESAKYHWAGPVQHGASTLPDDAFFNFVESGAAEVHLATGFQDILYDLGIDKYTPLAAVIQRHLATNLLAEWKEGKTFIQFYKEARKKANGPFKWQIWTMPENFRVNVSEALQAKFAFLFQALGVDDTEDIVARYVRPVDFHLAFPEEDVAAAGQGKDEGAEGTAD